MRSFFLILLLTACTGTPSDAPLPESATRVGRVVPLTAFGDEPRVRMFPNVAMLPENAPEIRIVPEDRQGPGPVFAVWEVRGDEAHERLDLLPRWHWSEDFSTAILAPQGLKKGAPYLISAEGLKGPDGAYATWSRQLRVVPADTTPPDGSALKVVGKPAPGTMAPLTLRFPEPVHEASVHSLATLVNGEPLEQKWSLSEDQRVATFTPAEPWADGDVQVSVGANVRDIAGNTLVNLGSPMLQPQVLLE